ncbi:MAG: T9SS type A sorting domain-containing protein [Flavobacteriales bacterium]|nr:T9SS type A sorting domain-containing protein [Flavobacteriales bacterium]
MRKFLLSLALFSSVVVSAQITSLTVEEIYTDDGTVTDYPIGYTTYHIYANMTNPNDVLSTIYGEVQTPLLLTITDGCMWNSFFGAENGGELNTAFCAFSPAACYDSFFTIGRINSSDPGGAIFLVEDGSQQFSNQFNNNTPCGGSFVVNTQVGGAYFGLPGDVNLFPENGKVLLAQITTDGCISGSFNAQVFPNWDSPGDPFIEQSNLQFFAPGCGAESYGCIDSGAINYDPAATEDNGSCLTCDLTISNFVATPPLCSNNTNGSVTVTVQTTSDFFPKYSLNNGAYTFGSPPLTKTYSNLGSGNYTVYARDTKFDDPGFNPGGIYGTCIVSQTANLTVLPVTIPTSTVTNITCNGAGNGTVVNAGANGGNGDYDYYLQYSPENTSVLDGNGNPIVLGTPSYNQLLPDCYRWQVIDGNGCTANSTQFCVTQPGALFLIVSSTVGATCSNSNNGTVVVTWGGGVGDVDWSLNIGGPYIDGTNVITNVPAGPGVMYGMDSNGCIDDVPFTINAPAAVVVNANATDPLCFNGTNGSIAASATGGNNSFTYSLDNISFGPGNFGGLNPGGYTIYALDGNNCAGQTTVTVDNPAEIDASNTVTEVSCNGENDGCVNVLINGGTSPYTVNGTNLVQFCDLAPGNYTYDILDANGCATTTEGTITEPTVLEATATGSDVSCNNEGDGSIVVVATGGIAPFVYSNNCGNNFQASNTFEDLDGGTFCLVVEDDNGCEVTISSVTIDEPVELEGTITTISGVDEDGGDISLNITGGTGDYEIAWTGPGGFSSDVEDLSGLDDAGTYTVTVTDENGCSWTDQVTITGINEFGQLFTINVSPNPTAGIFNLNIQGITENVVRYQITDAQGRMVEERMLNKNQSAVYEQINISHVESGVYFLNLLIGDSVQTIKVIKQ